jgi:hypothetical protein
MKTLGARIIRRWRETACYGIAIGIILFTAAPVPVHAYSDHLWKNGECDWADEYVVPKEALDRLIKACTAEIARGGDAGCETCVKEPVFLIRYYRALAYFRKGQFSQALKDTGQSITEFEADPNQLSQTKERILCYYLSVCPKSS